MSEEPSVSAVSIPHEAGPHRHQGQVGDGGARRVDRSRSEQSGTGDLDEEVLAFAAGGDRAVLTLNRKHLVRLYQEWPRHAGTAVYTFDADFERQARQIHRALDG